MVDEDQQGNEPSIADKIMAAGRALTTPAQVDESDPNFLPNQQMAGQGMANVFNAANAMTPNPVTVPAGSVNVGGKDVEIPSMSFDPTAIAGTVKGVGTAAKALDMSEAARAARAEQMGFDTSKTYYHGTESGDIEHFKPQNRPKNGAMFGQGIYTSSSPEEANQYAVKGSANVIPVHVKYEKAFNLNDPADSKLVAAIKNEVSPDAHDLLDSAKKNYQIMDVMKGRVPEYRRTQLLEDRGYDAVIDGPTTMVFNPDQVRSKFAEFDPKKKSSPKISYAEGGIVGQDSQPTDAQPQTQGVQIWDISGAKPVLGSVPHEDVTQAVASGKYSLPKGTEIPVINPDGDHGTIPPEDAPKAFQNGYRYATPQDLEEAKYSTGEQQLKAGAEGLAQGFAGPLATLGEKALGVKDEDILKRAKYNPATHGIAEAGGFLGSLATGVGEGALVGKAGEAIGAALKGESLLSRIGGAGAQAASEMAILQGGDEINKMVLHDPDQTAGTVLTDVGLAAVLGGAGGAALGSVSPLWEATLGTKAGKMLKAVYNKANGADIPLQSGVEEAIRHSGIELAPEVKALASSDPQLQDWGRALAQSDTTSSGQAFQKSLTEARNQGSDILAQTLGKSPADLEKMPDISTYERGKDLGNTLAKEYNAQVSPLAKGFEDIKAKYADAPLSPSVADKQEVFQSELTKQQKQLNALNKELRKAKAANDPSAMVDAAAKAGDVQRTIQQLKEGMRSPGIVDSVSEKLGNLALKEGWTASPSSDIMKEVARIQRELPNLKSVKHLGDYITAVGNNMQSDPLNGPLTRAGSMIKSILKDAEAAAIENHVGKKEGAEAVARYAELRKAYAQQSAVKEALDDRLKIRGSTSAFGKNLAEMAQTDGESVLRRLSGKGDANLLQVLAKNFPETANKLKQYHIDSLLQDAASKAKPGETLNAQRLFSNIEKMSPEIRNFVMDKNAQNKVQAVKAVFDALKDPHYNFSNTARVADKLLAGVGSSATGMITGVLTHNPYMGFLLGSLTKAMGRDAPDAVKLALLKFLGSSAPLDSGAVKAMVDYVNAAARGQKLIQRSIKNVFKSGAEVLPDSALPTDRDRNSIQKSLKVAANDPEQMTQVSGKIGHYLPEHSIAVGKITGGALAYLGSQKPILTKAAPLDKDPEPTNIQKAAYKRALDIAQQPLIVLKDIKEGTITPSDVKAVAQMYPALYSKVSQELFNQMSEHIAKGNEIPYKTRMGLSLFMGKPLDSTMTPQAIMAAQPKPQQPQQASPQQPASRPKHSMASLNKLPGQYSTKTQSNEAKSKEA